MWTVEWSESECRFWEKGQRRAVRMVSSRSGGGGSSGSSTISENVSVVFISQPFSSLLAIQLIKPHLATEGSSRVLHSRCTRGPAQLSQLHSASLRRSALMDCTDSAGGEMKTTPKL